MFKEDKTQYCENCYDLQEQLNQLKAENEKLKEEIKTNGFGCFNIEMSEELDQLKKENEKLKEEKQGLIKDWEEKKNLGYEIACKNEKLKQTLKEIKEIACRLPIGATRQEILQKISEVINER